MGDRILAEPQFTGGVRVTQQLRELIEGSNLDGTGSRELLFHARNGSGRQHAAIRAHYSLTPGGCFRLRIDIQGEQPVGASDRLWFAGQFGIEDFVEVGRGISGDEQNPFSGIGEPNCCGAGGGGFPHTAFLVRNCDDFSQAYSYIN